MYPIIAPVGLEDPISPEQLDASSQSSLSAPDSNDLQVEDASDTILGRSKFLDIPRNIIKSILWTADANTFASLSLLNRQWYTEAQDVELYAHHLSRCPSYALSNAVLTGPFQAADLFTFKTRFAAEVRRNLFDAFTRPRRTFIKLISVSANSSAAFPGGEAFRFEFSPNGRTILALSSSRIYVLDATSDSLVVKRELKTLRRPISASITDDGTLLAVLSSKFQANIYGLPPGSKIRHLQVIVLDHCPRTIAIAHEGTVLAAAYETGVEVFSLAANALSTDRRAVRSEAVDILCFSGDGSMLVGSSLNLEEPNAVVISAPFYTENDPDLTPREMHSRMWTTQILFPQISSVCSHVTLLSGHTEGDATWLFAYDHSLLSYRAVRTDDTRTGVAYFLGPPTANRFSIPSPTIAPIASNCGTLAVAGFSGSGLCLYGIPQKLDTGPDMAAVVERHERRLQVDGPLTTATGNFEPLMAYSPSVSGVSDSIEDDTIASKVDWRQSLFVKCKPIDSLRGHTAAKWVEQSDHTQPGFRGKRLLVVAPGGVGMTGGDFGDEPVPLDGSRLCFLDFDYSPSVAKDREITVEVGENEAELLIEHTGSIATEVALERRRTIRGMPGGAAQRAILGRSITAITPPSNFMQNHERHQSVSQPPSPNEDAVKLKQPSPADLHRASSVSGFRNALYPPRPPLGSQQYVASGADNQGRAPSIDSWETPPPPYIDGNRNNPATAQHAGQVSGAPPVTGVGAPPPGVAPSHPTGFVPYRSQNSRASTGMDGMPMIDTGPTRRAMSQYGALARSARLRDHSMSSLNSVGGSPANRHAVRSMDLSPSASGYESPSQVVDAYFQRQRPYTHYGPSNESSSARSRTFSNPVSPASSSDERQQHRSGFVSPEQPSSRLSLTGANLQNRLNHPVPPVPEEEPSVPTVPEQYRRQMSQPQSAPPQRPATAAASAPKQMPYQAAAQYGHFDATHQHQNGLPSAPVRKPVPLSNRVNLPSAAPPQASQTGGAWHVSDRPEYPAFEQSRDNRQDNNAAWVANDNTDAGLHVHHYHQPHTNMPPPQPPPPPTQPDGLLHRNNLASLSTPNLLRPSYNTRLDHIDSTPEDPPPENSPGIAFNIGRRMSRAQSMIYSPLQRERARPSRQSREQSAYAETVQTMPDAAAAKTTKKVRKRRETTKDENERSGSKKGSKCLVM